MEIPSNYFQLHLRTMCLFGVRLIPIENKLLKFLYNVYSIIFLGFTIFVYNVMEWIGTFKTMNDLNHFTLKLCFVATHVLGVIKTVIMLFKKDSIRSLLTRIEGGMFAPDPKGAGARNQLIKEAITYSNMQFTSFYMLCIVVMSLRTVYLIVSEGIPIERFDPEINSTKTVFVKEYPFDMWFPFDGTVTPLYEIISCYQILSCFTSGIHIGGIDAIICGSMMHMRSQFLIIKDNLERMTDPDNEEGSEEVHAGEVLTLPENITSKAHDVVVHCVQHYQTILDFCDEIEREFRYLMLAQFLTSLMTTCFVFFQLTLIDVNSFAFLSIAMYQALMTGQIFFFCFAGQQVMFASDMLSTDIFHSKWFLTKQTTQKSLLMMLTRANRTIKFTAGKFSFLNLQTFITILRASYSYFMVLKQTTAREDQ